MRTGNTIDWPARNRRTSQPIDKQEERDRPDIDRAEHDGFTP